jgi:hypothetical protein
MKVDRELGAVGGKDRCSTPIARVSDMECLELEGVILKLHSTALLSNLAVDAWIQTRRKTQGINTISILKMNRSS